MDVLQTQFVNGALKQRDICSTDILSRSLVVAILIFSSGCSFKYSLFIVLSIVFGKAAVSWNSMLINNWSRWLNIAVKFWCLVSSRESTWEGHSGQNVVRVNFKGLKGCIHGGDRWDRGSGVAPNNLTQSPLGDRLCLPLQRPQLFFPCGYVPGSRKTWIGVTFFSMKNQGLGAPYC